MTAVSDIDRQTVMIDATVVRAHACSSGYQKEGNEAQALGRSKGGFTTKIHALVDALGNPIKFILTGGHRHDITQAAELLKGQQNTSVIADKGYASQEFVDTVESQDCVAIIPSKKNAKNPRNIDREQYKERFLIEAFFSKLKHFRRSKSKADLNAMALLYLENIILNTATAINNAAMYDDLKQTRIALIESQKISQFTRIFEKFVPKQFLAKISTQGMTKKYGVKILISQYNMEKLSYRKKYQIRPLGFSFIKERKQSINIFEVFDSDDENIIQLKMQSLPCVEQAVDFIGKKRLRWQKKPCGKP